MCVWTLLLPQLALYYWNVKQKVQTKISMKYPFNSFFVEMWEVGYGGVLVNVRFAGY